MYKNYNSLFVLQKNSCSTFKKNIIQKNIDDLQINQEMLDTGSVKSLLSKTLAQQFYFELAKEFL